MVSANTAGRRPSLKPVTASPAPLPVLPTQVPSSKPRIQRSASVSAIRSTPNSVPLSARRHATSATALDDHRVSRPVSRLRSNHVEIDFDDSDSPAVPSTANSHNLTRRPSLTPSISTTSLRPSTSTTRLLNTPATPRSQPKKIDRVSRYQQLSAEWSKSSFLRSLDVRR